MPNPVSHFIDFLTKPFYGEPYAVHFVYWALAISSLVIAAVAAGSVPVNNWGVHLWRFAVRFVIGSFWWQQTLWKFPTNTGGLEYWTKLEVAHAAIPLQSQLIKVLVLPVFTPFAYGVYAFEALVAVSVLLGLFTRVFSVLGALLIFSLFTGLYSAPGEWPWSYAFLTLIMVTMAVEDYGMSFGVDMLLAHRSPAAKRQRAAQVAY